MGKIFAVIGNPVLHSMSPQMHSHALREMKIDAIYIRLAAETKEEALRLAKEIGISGFSVTTPFKTIIENMDENDESARKAGAVNTVLFKDGKTIGYNTDWYGVVGPLLANDVQIRNQKAIVLGAGGAARAAVYGLQKEGAKIVIANRTVEKAQRLAEEFGSEYCSLDELPQHVHGCRILAGCISTAGRIIPKELLREDMAIVDAYYTKETALAKDGREAGAAVFDGREWLVYQGMKSFELFTGIKAPEKILRQGVRKREKKANIALIGAMGSGKNTVARSFNGMEVFDVDKEIEKSSGPITKIFEEKGEQAFRDLESKELEKISGKTNTVISCGGGAILRDENRKLLNENAIVVWLWAAPETLIKRIPKDGTRPLLNTDDPEKRIRELLAQRKAAYAETCDMIISTGGKKPEDIAKRISYEIDYAFGS